MFLLAGSRGQDSGRGGGMLICFERFPDHRRLIVIEIMPESKSSALALKASGKLTDADYKEVLIPKIEEIIKRSGKAKVLLHLPQDFIGWDAHAMWDDARFGLRHRNDFQKLAVVGGANGSNGQQTSAPIS